MNVTPLTIPDVLLIEPKVFGDERGFFYESFNQAAFNKATGLDISFVQDNHSKSARNVLRGLHYQTPPKAQGKLVRVLAGEVFDVALDIRKDSSTFGHWVGERLSAANKRQMWIPPGFAHGFLVLSDSAEFLYKTTDDYAPDYERSILWNDPALGIDWPLTGSPVLSAKDTQAVPFVGIGLSNDPASVVGEPYVVTIPRQNRGIVSRSKRLFRDANAALALSASSR